MISSVVAIRYSICLDARSAENVWRFHCHSSAFAWVLRALRTPDFPGPTACQQTVHNPGEPTLPQLVHAPAAASPLPPALSSADRPSQRGPDIT